MTIIALRKVSLCGVVADKAPILAELQALGCMHLIPLRSADADPAAREWVRDVRHALRDLGRVSGPRPWVRDDTDFDLDAVVARVLAIEDRRRELEDERDRLEQRIAALGSWGDFRFPPVEALAGYRLWFYEVPAWQLRRLDRLDLPWQVVHRNVTTAYVVVVAKDLPPADAIPAPRVRTGAVPLSRLRRRLERVGNMLEDLLAERQSLTRWTWLLRSNLARAEDRSALDRASRQALETDALFAVQGWAPRDAVPQLEELARTHGLALLVETPAEGEEPPTLLRNAPVLAGGQDVIGLYQLPGYAGWDPSSVVFFSFALFFAMILADAGYALLFAGALLWFWRRLGRGGERSRRLRALAVAIVLFSIGYGVLVGSYFGAPPAVDSTLAGLRVLDVGDFDAMMHVSIVIGCLHLMLANLVVFWRRPRLHLARLGWVGMILGGLVTWLAGGGAAATVGFALVGTGIGTVLLFKGTAPVRSGRDLVKRLTDGLLGLTGISQLFGDVLSYLRLFALGLASASLAMTFNTMAGDLRAGVPGLGVLLSLIVLVAGHAINLLLCVVGGFVHGLRLNFIEFFNWGLEGEGYAFQPFCRKGFES